MKEGWTKERWVLFSQYCEKWEISIYFTQGEEQTDAFAECPFKISCIYFCFRSVPPGMPTLAWMAVELCIRGCQWRCYLGCILAPCTEPLFSTLKCTLLPPQVPWDLLSEFPQTCSAWNTGCLITQDTSACFLYCNSSLLFIWLSLYCCPVYCGHYSTKLTPF